MTDESPASADPIPAAPAVSPYGTKGLEFWLAANRTKFTEEALRTAAVASGWEATIVDTALGKLRDAERTGPARARARRISRWLYLTGFLILSALMIVGGNPAGMIGVVVLAITLGVAYAVGNAWVRSTAIGTEASTRAAVVLLVGPVVLWLAVTGLCVATGLPTYVFLS